MSSGFITEAEIEEKRRIRQEEWDKVRKPDEPEKAPEEEYVDNRTLFERLEEQRQKKELEYEETHRLKNMIKGLDDDEIEFLDLVDRTKMEEEKRLMKEEAKELEEFRNKVAAQREKSLDKKLEEEIKPVFSRLNDTFLSPTSMTPHNKVLANLVKKRAASEKLPSPPAKKPTGDKSSAADVNGDSKSKANVTNSANSVASKSNDHADSEGTDLINLNFDSASANGISQVMVYPSAMKCVGVLPGIGSYISDDSSDSDHTSGSDLEDQIGYDLRGHKVDKKEIKID